VRYLIVGGGCAGVEAAREIRRRDKDGKITIINDSSEFFIFRPALKEYLMDEILKDELRVLPAGFFIDNRIEFVHGKIVSVDAEKNEIVMEINSNKIIRKYDRLLLALGGKPILPPYLAGHKFTNVFQFKSLSDTERIKSSLRSSDGECIIVGGGVLGVETAEMLARLGRKVTLLSRSENLVFKGIPSGLKTRVKKLFEKNGVEILTSKNVTDIKRSKDRLSGLVLDNGKVLNLDILIACTGISPDLKLAEDAALEISKGIHVDRSMRSSNEFIFAAGDCAVMEWSSRKTLRLWEPSRRMGRVAGANMAGGDENFDPFPSFYHTYLFGVPLGFFGDFDADEKKYDRVIKKTDDGYKEIVIENGRLVGASFMGGRPFPPAFIHLMKTGKKIPGGLEELLDDGFDLESLWYI